MEAVEKYCEIILKSHFSKSLEVHNYNLSHPMFEEYCGACIRSNNFINEDLIAISKDSAFFEKIKKKYPESNIELRGVVWYDADANINYDYSSQDNKKSSSELDELLSDPLNKKLFDKLAKLSAAKKKALLALIEDQESD